MASVAIYLADILQRISFFLFILYNFVYTIYNQQIPTFVGLLYDRKNYADAKNQKKRKYLEANAPYLNEKETII